MRPAAFFRLLPLAPLPRELREQVLSLCTSTAEDALAYRRRVVRQAEWKWLARLSWAIRRVSWSTIRAYPGVAIAAVAVALWVVAAVSVTLVTFAGSGAAQAQTPQTSGSRAAYPQATRTSVVTYSRSPAAMASAPTPGAARPSPTASQPPAYVPTPVQMVPSRVAATSPAPWLLYVVLTPAVEIARTIAFRLIFTIAFAHGISVPLIVHAATSSLRPTGLRRAVRWGSPCGPDSCHCLPAAVYPDGGGPADGRSAAVGELVLGGSLVPCQRSPVGELIPDGQGFRVLGAEDFLIGG